MTIRRILSEKVCKRLLYGELAFILLLVAIINIGIGQEHTNDGAEYDYGQLQGVSNDTVPGVVKLKVCKRDGKGGGYGTGFFISGSGRLITCNHVIKNAESITAITPYGRVYAVEKIIAVDKTTDLALLQMDVQDEDVPFLKLADELPGFGDIVKTVGYPKGGPLQGASGEVYSVGQIATICKTFQISAPVSPGCSGSPVLNASDEVIGIAKAHSRRKLSIPATFATPIDRVFDIQPRGKTDSF